MNRAWRDSVLLLFYCGFIFWLSAQQDLSHPALIENQDKLHHLAAYGVMAWLAWRSFAHVVANRSWRMLAVVTFCSLYGLSDEWHQSFVPGRFADTADWVADTLGAVLVVILLRLVPARRDPG